MTMVKSVNRTDFSRLVAEDLALEAGEVDRVVTAAIEVAARVLAEGDRLVVRGFGTFEPRVRQARVSRFGEDTDGDGDGQPYVRIAFKPAHKLKSTAFAAFHARGELDAYDR